MMADETFKLYDKYIYVNKNCLIYSQNIHCVIHTGPSCLLYHILRKGYHSIVHMEARWHNVGSTEMLTVFNLGPATNNVSCLVFGCLTL